MDKRASLALLEAADLVGSAFRRRFKGRSFLLTGNVHSSVGDFMIGWGARSVLRLVTPPANGTNTYDRFNGLDEELRDPSAQLATELQAKDPNGDAIIYAGSFTGVEVCCGRYILGARRRAWYLSEDKAQQVCWTDHPRMHQEWLVRPSRSELLETVVRWPNSQIVLSGSPLNRLAIAGSHTFLVSRNQIHHAHYLDTVMDYLVGTCGGVRVSSVTGGQSATFYGFVHEDETLVFPGVRALTFVGHPSRRIASVGILTPLRLSPAPVEVPETVKVIARRLMAAVGYAGAFGIDGAIVEDEFVAHEINSRICAGFRLLNTQDRSLLPTNMVDIALREALISDVSALFAALREAQGAEFSRPSLALWQDADLERQLLTKLPVSTRPGAMDGWERHVFAALQSRYGQPLHQLEPGTD